MIATVAALWGEPERTPTVSEPPPPSSSDLPRHPVAAEAPPLVSDVPRPSGPPPANECSTPLSPSPPESGAGAGSGFGFGDGAYGAGAADGSGSGDGAYERPIVGAGVAPARGAIETERSSAVAVKNEAPATPVARWRPSRPVMLQAGGALLAGLVAVSLYGALGGSGDDGNRGIKEESTRSPGDPAEVKAGPVEAEAHAVVSDNGDGDQIYLGEDTLRQAEVRVVGQPIIGSSRQAEEPSLSVVSPVAIQGGNLGPDSDHEEPGAFSLPVSVDLPQLLSLVKKLIELEFRQKLFTDHMQEECESSGNHPMGYYKPEAHLMRRHVREMRKFLASSSMDDFVLVEFEDFRQLTFDLAAREEILTTVIKHRYLPCAVAAEYLPLHQRLYRFELRLQKYVAERRSPGHSGTPVSRVISTD